MLAGKNEKTQTVAVLCGFGEREELEALKPNVILSTTADLTAILISNFLKI